MGMYTEINLNFRFIDNLPKQVIDCINVMIGNKEPETIEVPDHEFFKTSRWYFLLNCYSYYHIPFCTIQFRYNDVSQNYYLTGRSDIKNYDSEIELFFDWVKPYVDSRGQEKTYIGYSIYEEDDEPTLYYKDNSSVQTNT